MAKPETETAAQAERNAEPEESVTARRDGRASGTAHSERDSQMVYRRAGPRDDNELRIKSAEGVQARGREIAPAITPLVIGFTLLLALISLLGYFSVGR